MSMGDIAWQELACNPALDEALMEILEAIGMGIAQLDAHGRISKLNRPARLMLMDGDTLTQSEQRLIISNRRENRKFQQVLNRALPSAGAPAVAGSAVATRPAGLPPLVMQVNPLRSCEKDTPSRSVAALLLMVDPQSDIGIDPALVKVALSLTAKETNVAVMLAQGKNVRQITALTKRSEGTIRTQVRSILAKLGLSRQTDLVILVRSLGVVRWL